MRLKTGVNAHFLTFAAVVRHGCVIDLELFTRSAPRLAACADLAASCDLARVDPLSVRRAPTKTRKDP
jgi:hypothetical protein